MEHETLATELLCQVKQNARRWFIAFCVMVALEIGTIVGFLWYISLPIDEYSISYEQNADEIEGSDVKQTIGGSDHGESKTDSSENF